MKYYSKSTRFLFPRNVDDKKSENCTSWLKYLRRAYITHCLRKGTKGIIRLWRHNKKQETNTSNDKPCWEATVRMAVVCILVWYFFNRGLYLKVVFFFRYRTAIAQNPRRYPCLSAVSCWYTEPLKDKGAGEERRKECSVPMDPHAGLIKTTEYI